MERHSQVYPRGVHGIDFSGAADAGRKIWIASGKIDRNILRIEECRRAETLPGSGRSRDECFSALRDFIEQEQKSVFGFDFPFGLPKKVIQELFVVNKWEEFVISFSRRYFCHMDFRKECRLTYGHEIKRTTDKKSKTPFSPYNLRVYRQTYFGIRDILAPLVRDNLVSVLPMQSAQLDKPWILEICPASTLKQLENQLKQKNLYKPYKVKGHRDQRLQILESIKGTGALSIPARSIEEKIINDSGGDALDSIIAAYSTFCAYRNNFKIEGEYNKNYNLEGYVFI